MSLTSFANSLAISAAEASLENNAYKFLNLSAKQLSYSLDASEFFKESNPFSMVPSNIMH
jgi:hypothetical protein